MEHLPALDVIQSLTKLNVTLYSIHGKLVTQIGGLDIPPWLMFSFRDSRGQPSIRFNDDGDMVLYRGLSCLEYAAALYNRDHLILVGPFLSHDFSPVQLPRIFNELKIPLGERPRISHFYSSLPQRDKDEIKALASLLKGAEWLLKGELQTQTESLGEGHLPNSDVIRDERIIELRYLWEKKVRNAIAQGDRKTLNEFFLDYSTDFDFSSRLPSNPLRLQKNMVIVLNTICRLSAERGGLSPMTLHGLSEKYAIRLEACDNPDELILLCQRMIYEYCDSVHKLSLSAFSRPVRRTISYIRNHLNSPIRLDQLANRAECNPSYLSRLFRAEMGRTITSYLNELRVDEAKWLLEDEVVSITDVALQVGFSDVNYFSKVFKKITRESPSDYRRNSLSDHPNGLP